VQSKTAPYVLALLALAISACGSASNRSAGALRIFDPTGTVKTQVTSADVIRASVRAHRVEGSGVLSLRLTHFGAKKLQRLTEALAIRGRRRHQPQVAVVQLDDQRHRILIDYRTTPDGLTDTDTDGLEISALTPRAAERFAQELRQPLAHQ
jgi:hypothetical protein